jgi:ribonuclease I
MPVKIRTGGAILSILRFSVASTEARSHKHRARSSPSFDYYVLSLSYAPDFCDEPGGHKDPRECGTGRHVGFVVHVRVTICPLRRLSRAMPGALGI